jgi:hypothetical protein
MGNNKSFYGAWWRNTWRGIAGVIAAVALLVPSVALAQTLTGTFAGKGTGREVAFQHKGVALTDWAGSLKLKIDNGPQVLVFCIQIDVQVRSGDRYQSDGPVLALPNGCQIRYLLDKYPAASAKTADEAAARQLAIWVFSDGVDPNTIEDATIRDRALALVAEAQQGPCPMRRTEGPDLTLEPQSANPAAGQTVAYTVRASAADAGQNVTVAVTGPAVLSDASGANSGQQQQEVALDGQGVAMFWVTGTGPGDTSVRVDLPYRLEAGTVFSHLENAAPTQRLVLAENRSLTASATAQLTWTGSAQPPTATAPVSAPEQATATAPASAPQPPVATAPAMTPQATPEAATAVPPTATRRPNRDHNNDDEDTPEATEQPTQVVNSEEQATAVPTPGEADLTAIAAAAAQGEQATPTSQASPDAQAAPATSVAPAGGAPQVQPRSLPNTSAPDASMRWLLWLSAGLLVLGGCMLRRR